MVCSVDKEVSVRSKSDSDLLSCPLSECDRLY